MHALYHCATVQFESCQCLLNYAEHDFCATLKIKHVNFSTLCVLPRAE